MADYEHSPADALLEGAPACHWIANQEGVFERVYGDTIAAFGKPPRDVAGQPADKVLHPSALPLWRERLRRALSGETLVLREQRGSRFWCISMFPLRLRPGETHAGGMIREITSFVRADRDVGRGVLDAAQARESYRAETARFLHNVVGQNLAALGLRLDLLRMDLDGGVPEVCERLRETQALLESVMEQVRKFSYELNPSPLERVGLRSAMERLAVRAREYFQGEVRVEVDTAVEIAPGLASALYRIAGEAVADASKHFGCSLIEIAIESADNGAWMEVRDNGQGFDPAEVGQKGGGLGLLRMEQHAAEAGLRLSISSSRQSGTIVRVAAPAPEGEQPC